MKKLVFWEERKADGLKVEVFAAVSEFRVVFTDTDAGEVAGVRVYPDDKEGLAIEYARSLLPDPPPERMAIPEKGFRLDVFRRALSAREAAFRRVHPLTRSDDVPEIVVLDPRLPEIYEPTVTCPGYVLDETTPGYACLVPVLDPDGKPTPVPNGPRYAGPMASGNYAWGCDGRLRVLGDRPLPLHDRFETWEAYRMMST